jgi:hypothetical protein
MGRPPKSAVLSATDRGKVATLGRGASSSAAIAAKGNSMLMSAIEVASLAAIILVFLPIRR